MNTLLNDRLAISILLANLIFRIVIAIFLYPGYDEAYYYIYSHHLDWSYFDHPPIVALSTGLGTWLTGQVNQFTIRWGVLSLYTGSLILMYLTGLRLYGLAVARMTLILASVIPIFSVVFGILTQPDSPLMFFWSLTVYLAVREFFGVETYKPTYRLALIGLAVGLAVLSKYHGFVLGFGLVLFCATTPRYWSVFRSKWLGLGFILFLLSLFPIIYWNIQQDWVSFRFHLEDRFNSEPTSFSLLRVLIVFAISIGTMCPTFGVPMWWVTFKSFWQEIPSFLSVKTFYHRGEENLKPWLILCVSFPLIIGMLYIGGYHHLAPSWILPGFWSCTILLADRAVLWQKHSRRAVKRWLVGSTIFIITLVTIGLLHLTLGTLQKPSQYALFGGLIPPRQDPSTEVVDILQLRQGLADSPELLEILKNSGFVFTQSFYIAGWLDMAIYPLVPVPVTAFTGDTRGFGIWYDQRDWIGKDGLLISTNAFVKNNEKVDRYRPYFQSIEKVGVIPILRGGETIEQFHIYRAKNFLKPYP